MQGKQLPKRMISVDILKISAMLMVVFLHATSSNYGLKDISVSWGSLQYLFVVALRMFSMCAVNCFVLISGYFYSAKNIKYTKLITLWLQVEFYSVGIYLLLCIVPNSGVTFNIKALIYCLLPLLTGRYWFFTDYFLLMLISPMLNTFMNKLGKSEFRNYLIVLLTVFSLIPTLNIFGDTFGTENGFSLLWFAVLYLLEGYLRNYPPKAKYYRKKYVGICLIMCVVFISADYLKQYISVFGAVSNLLSTYNHVLVLLSAVMLFCAAIRSPSEHQGNFSKIISKCAGMSFGVYLLHEHPQIRSFLWQELVNLQSVAHAPVRLGVQIIVTAVLVFLAAITIELIRMVIFQLVGKVFKNTPLIIKLQNIQTRRD